MISFAALVSVSSFLSCNEASTFGCIATTNTIIAEAHRTEFLHVSLVLLEQCIVKCFSTTWCELSKILH